MSLVAEIASKFDGARQTGPEQWEACCPIHGDQEASLGIGALKNVDGVGVNCFAGCDTIEILKSRGLEYSDLFAANSGSRQPQRTAKSNRKRKSLGKIVAEYLYRDRQRKSIFRKVRDENKQFAVQRPDGKGGWIFGIGDAERVLYRENEIINAEPDEILNIFEGEKDVDNAVRLGLNGTTNHDGAGNWNDEKSKLFAGRCVVVWCDNDEPGIKHGEAVAASLHAAGAESIRVICFRGLPKGGDVSDIIEQGATGDDLYGVILATPVWEPSSARPATTSAVKKKERPQSLVYNAIERFEEDADGNERKVIEPLTMKEAVELITKSTNNFPRRTGSTLFVHCPEHGIAWLQSPAATFGWIARQAGIVEWHKTRGCVSKEEVFHEFRRSAINYAAVENLTHEPPRADHYYACPPVTPGNGKWLNILLDRFNPETEIDRDLILALLMTVLWGGSGGLRPCFVITTDDGPGSGKTTLVRMAASIFGGLLSFDRGEQVSDIKTRLLSADALTKRICLIDNVKSAKWSWGEFEGLVTASDISGHRMYQGESTRPNTIVWCLTLNGANLSTDMAQRSVIIKLRKPINSGVWEDQTRGFIEQHRNELIADLVGALRATPYKFEKFTRWADWESAVLARVPNALVAQQAIADRQGTVDAEQEENEDLEEHFARELRHLGYDIENDRVFIPSLTCCIWVNRAMQEKSSKTAVTRNLRRMIKEGRFVSLVECGTKSYGRGFLWAGVKSFGRNTFTDLDSRIGNKLRNQEEQESF